MQANGPAVSVSKRRWVDQRAYVDLHVFGTGFLSPQGARRGAIFAPQLEYFFRAGVSRYKLAGDKNF